METKYPSLTHVLMWDARQGYTPVSLTEACRKYPSSVSAKEGIFVCELCGQKVLLTNEGNRSRHFRHDPNALNKTCEERCSTNGSSIFGSTLNSFNNPFLPIRLILSQQSFALELIFFYPLHTELSGSIEIEAEGRSLTRIDITEKLLRDRISNIGVQVEPKSAYAGRYLGISKEFSKYWPRKIPGFSPEGTLFDATSGYLIPHGSKITINRDYFFLRRGELFHLCSGQQARLIGEKRYNGALWYLYKTRFENLSIDAGNFCLRHGLRLTPTMYETQIIWPPHIQSPHFIYHNYAQLLLYSRERGVIPRVYPGPQRKYTYETGDVYELDACEAEHIISLGKHGRCSLSYIQKGHLGTQSEKPHIRIYDANGNEWQQDTKSQLPPKNRLIAESEFDGRVDVIENEKIINILKLNPNIPKQIPDIRPGMALSFFCGCDHIQTIHFRRSTHPATEQINQLLTLEYSDYPRFAHNFNNAFAVVEDFKEIVPAFIYAAHKGRLPLLVLGAKCKDLADVLSLSLYGIRAKNMSNRIEERFMADDIRDRVFYFEIQGNNHHLPKKALALKYDNIPQHIIWGKEEGGVRVEYNKWDYNILPILGESFLVDMTSQNCMPEVQTYDADVFRLANAGNDPCLKAMSELNINPILQSKFIQTIHIANNILDRYCNVETTSTKKTSLKVLFGILPIAALTGRTEMLTKFINMNVASALKIEMRRWIK